MIQLYGITETQILTQLKNLCKHLNEKRSLIEKIFMIMQNSLMRSFLKFATILFKTIRSQSLIISDPPWLNEMIKSKIMEKNSQVFRK